MSGAAAGERHARRPVGRRFHREAVLLQRGAREHLQCRVVVHHQDKGLRVAHSF